MMCYKKTQKKSLNPPRMTANAEQEILFTLDMHICARGLNFTSGVKSHNFLHSDLEI